jgi:hypothetical protein
MLHEIHCQHPVSGGEAILTVSRKSGAIIDPVVDIVHRPDSSGINDDAFAFGCTGFQILNQADSLTPYGPKIRSEWRQRSSST